MKTEDLNLLLQLVTSMSLDSQGLEKTLEKRDIEKFKKIREEILNFQRQIAKLIG